MDIRISPGALSGSVKIPPSKSAAHRAVICAALADGVSEIAGIGDNDDVAATLSAVRTLGAAADVHDDTAFVCGVKASQVPRAASIDCMESGSTLRFMVPVAAALGVEASFYGRGRLPQRPISALVDAISGHGVEISRRGGEILTVSGKLKSGRFEIPGDISSQYITGPLFALPLLEGDSEIILTSPLESAGYVEITLSALRDFGVEIERIQGGYGVRGGQAYKSRKLEVEGDYSSAAFWLAAGAINSDIAITGLSPDSVQGDREIISAAQTFGARVAVNEGVLRVERTKLRGARLDVSGIPDLLPALAVIGAFAEGETELYGAARLRIKESDRLAAVTEGLRRLGAIVREYPDRLVIKGGTKLNGRDVESFGDHRIAMAMSIAALGCGGETVIRGAECVSKSYPGFYDDFKALGGKCDVVLMGE